MPANSAPPSLEQLGYDSTAAHVLDYLLQGRIEPFAAMEAADRVDAQMMSDAAKLGGVSVDGMLAAAGYPGAPVGRGLNPIAYPQTGRSPDVTLYAAARIAPARYGAIHHLAPGRAPEASRIALQAPDGPEDIADAYKVQHLFSPAALAVARYLNPNFTHTAAQRMNDARTAHPGVPLTPYDLKKVAYDLGQDIQAQYSALSSAERRHIDHLANYARRARSPQSPGVQPKSIWDYVKTNRDGQKNFLALSTAQHFIHGLATIDSLREALGSDPDAVYAFLLAKQDYTAMMIGQEAGLSRRVPDSSRNHADASGPAQAGGAEPPAHHHASRTQGEARKARHYGLPEDGYIPPSSGEHPGLTELDINVANAIAHRLDPRSRRLLAYIDDNWSENLAGSIHSYLAKLNRLPNQDELEVLLAHTESMAHDRYTDLPHDARVLADEVLAELQPRLVRHLSPDRDDIPPITLRREYQAYIAADHILGGLTELERAYGYVVQSDFRDNVARHVYDLMSDLTPETSLEELEKRLDQLSSNLTNELHDIQARDRFWRVRAQVYLADERKRQQQVQHPLGLQLSEVLRRSSIFVRGLAERYPQRWWNRMRTAERKQPAGPSSHKDYYRALRRDMLS